MRKGLKILGFGLAVCTMVPGVFLGTGCGAQDGIILDNFATEYYQGQDLDVSGAVIKYTKGGKTTDIPLEESMISNFNSDQVGGKKLVVEYKGFTITLDYTVKSIDWSGKYTYTTVTTEGKGLNVTLEVVDFRTVKINRVEEGVAGGTAMTTSYKPEVISGKLHVKVEVVNPPQEDNYWLITDITQTGFKLVRGNIGEELKNLNWNFVK